MLSSLITFVFLSCWCDCWCLNWQKCEVENPLLSLWPKRRRGIPFGGPLLGNIPFFPVSCGLLVCFISFWYLICQEDEIENLLLSMAFLWTVFLKVEGELVGRAYSFWLSLTGNFPCLLWPSHLYIYIVLMSKLSENEKNPLFFRPPLLNDKYIDYISFRMRDFALLGNSPVSYLSCADCISIVLALKYWWRHLHEFLWTQTQRRDTGPHMTQSLCLLTLSWQNPDSQEDNVLEFTQIISPKFASLSRCYFERNLECLFLFDLKRVSLFSRLSDLSLQTMLDSLGKLARLCLRSRAMA